MPPILTTARQGIWTAIEGWTPAASRIKKKWKYEDKPGFSPEPTIGDLPALQIYPAGGTSDWKTNQSQRVEQTVEFRLWTPDWDVTLAELLWQEIIAAVWQGFDNARATGFSWRVKGFSPLTSVPGNLAGNGPVATVSTWQLSIYSDEWNPKTYVSDN